MLPTKRANAVTEVELRQKQFQWEKMILAIDQAKKKKIVDGYTADAKKAEADLADEAIRRREIHAPFDGVVQDVKQHLGEWVKPGDPVVHAVQHGPAERRRRAEQRASIIRPMSPAGR